MPDITTKIAGLTLRNPVVLASGTVGYGPEYAEFIDYETVLFHSRLDAHTFTAGVRKMF